MPVFAQQGHHFGHCTPLVDTDQRSATLVFGGDKAQSLTHGHLAVGGGDDDARLSDSCTAGGGEHHVGRGQEDEASTFCSLKVSHRLSKSACAHKASWTIITLMNRPCSRAMDSMEEMEEIGPKNLRLRRSAYGARTAGSQVARAELEGR